MRAKIKKTGKKIGIFYVCLGSYYKFWDNFYKLAKRYLFPDADVHFYVYTDNKDIKSTEDTTVIEGIWGPWPECTLKRFEYYLNTYDYWKNEDYLYFFNANSVFIKPILTSDFVKKDLTACQHCAFKTLDHVDKCVGTRAHTDKLTCYMQGGLQGGAVENWKRALDVLYGWYKEDYAENIIPTWHDESYFNRYVNEHLTDFDIIERGYMAGIYYLDKKASISLIQKSIYFNNPDFRSC